MARLMRCLYCGALQDEPTGVKSCARCGGELQYEDAARPASGGSYITAQLELDQVYAPPGQNVDRYLLLTLCSPAEVPPEHAMPREQRRPPLHLVAVLDVSGSMSGTKLASAKEALRQALHFLQDGDVFSLVTFSDQVQTHLKAESYAQRKRDKMENLLDEIRASGMTALDGGLAQGIDLGQKKRQATTLVLLLSDGQANVGETDLEKIGLRAQKARQSGLIVSTLGVGLDYNEALMVEIANQGGGRFYHIQEGSQIPAALMQELGSAAMLAARQVEVEFDLPSGAALVSLTALYPLEMVNSRPLLKVGDLLPDVRVEIPLRLTLYPHAAGERFSVSGGVHHQTPRGQTLGLALNAVTVRFVEQRQFEERPGYVVPVMERVLEFRRAAHLLEFARLQERDSTLARQQAERERQALRDYARMFNPDKAMELEVEKIDALFATPKVAKQAMHRAARMIRGLD